MTVKAVAAAAKRFIIKKPGKPKRL